MISITFVLLVGYCSMHAMELPHDQQEKNKQKEQAYTILPADLCKKIGVYKSEIDGPAIEAAEMIKMSCPIDNALHRMSATWNSLIPQSHPDGNCDLWEHQLTYRKNYARGFNFRSVLHFDTITTGDFTTFTIDKERREGEHPSIEFKAMFDGPNNDGGPGAGVVLIADSYFGKRDQSDRKTRFYLFKQHGTEKKDSSGAQQAVVFPGQQIARRAYDGFPNRFKVPRDDRDYRTKGQYLDFCALAPYKRGIIASHSVYYTPYLNVFEYEHAANHAAPDQAFEVKMLASVCGGPRFTRLAWVYGRTLLGLTKDQQLYVVALDEHEEKTSIRFCPQKTDKKITNFCVARPHNHHIVFLCDDQKNMYTANLKHRNRLGAISMNMLTHKGKPLSDGLERVDRIWAYEDRLALMDTVKMKVLLFALVQQSWTAQNVNEVLQKKPVLVIPWKEPSYLIYRA